MKRLIVYARQKRLIVYARPYLLHIVVAAVAGIGCSIANVWVIDLLKQVIDAVVLGEIGTKLPELAGKAIIAIAVGLIANYLVISMTGLFGAGILRDLRRDSLNHIMKTAPDFMEKNNFGDIMERLSSDIEIIAGYMQTYFKDCLYVPIIVIVFAVYLVSMNPLLAGACLLPLAILVPLSVILLKPVKIAQSQYGKKLGMTNNNIQEAFDGADVIKSYNLQRRMEEKYYKALEETFHISNKNDLRQYHIEPISALVREAPTAIALCVGGYLAFQGSVTIGMLVAFIGAIKKINEPLVYVYQLVVRSQMAMVAVNRVFAVMDFPMEEMGKGITEIDKSGEAVFQFRDVSFRYSTVPEESTQNVLDGINLTIPKGKKIALIGKSGCGKSTILKLLCGQYQIGDGELLYYGNRLSEVSPEILRKDIALISQDTIIFPMSVLDNIRIGKPDASREEIINAAKLAGADTFIRSMPNGYDTVMTEKGNNLSGGQRQRISIARAILKDAPILLCDEPTSALDPETEKHVTKTINQIAQNKTVITVAHRLSTIADYDRIVEMEEGRIVKG